MTRKDNSGLRWLAIVCGDRGYALYAYPEEREYLLRDQDRIVGEYNTHREALHAVDIALGDMRKIELWQGEPNVPRMRKRSPNFWRKFVRS
jgi:hypothetical protein